MAQATTQTTNVSSTRRDRPWLLPSNRKLRNLVSVSVRNVVPTGAPKSRSRGKTIDDDAVPQTLKSPAKLFALKEQKALGHSRSSSDLQAVAEHAKTGGTDAESQSVSNGSPRSAKGKLVQVEEVDSPRRPGFKRMRRRSTLEWASVTPQKRQQELEDVAQQRMVDVFYSLHIQGIEEPIYVSEAIEKTSNPTFGHIDWTSCGPGITRMDRLTMRVWIRAGRAQAWKQLLQLKVEFPELQYLGKNLNDLDRTLTTNCVLFHLVDGIYSPFTGSLPDFASLHTTTSHQLAVSTIPKSAIAPTSTFDALLRLSKLDDSIQDALAVRNQIATDLESLLKSNREAQSHRDQVIEAEDRLKTIHFAKKMVEKQLEKSQMQKSSKSASLSARRKFMTADRAATQEQSKVMLHIRSDFSSMRTEHLAQKNAIQNQRRRICEELQYCYPIEPLPSKTLAFSIRGLHLPNTESLDSESPDTVSAAFGHVAHVLQLLSFYLAQPLPYPVTPLGSASTITDPISILKTNTPLTSQAAEQKLRTYPLFGKGMPRFRFEYAVFLVNQDIRILLESAFNVRVLDIRHTLPNLKYLLYVAAAGEGELPARKAGGVKGLLNTPPMERTGSSGSAGSGFSGVTLHSNGKPKVGAIDKLKEISGRR